MIVWITPLQMPAVSNNSIKLPEPTILPPWCITWWNICGIWRRNKTNQNGWGADEEKTGQENQGRNAL